MHWQLGGIRLIAWRQSQLLKSSPLSWLSIIMPMNVDLPIILRELKEKTLLIMGLLRKLILSKLVSNYNRILILIILMVMHRICTAAEMVIFSNHHSHTFTRAIIWIFQLSSTMKLLCLVFQTILQANNLATSRINISKTINLERAYLTLKIQLRLLAGTTTIFKWMQVETQESFIQIIWAASRAVPEASRTSGSPPLFWLTQISSSRVKVIY